MAVHTRTILFVLLLLCGQTMAGFWCKSTCYATVVAGGCLSAPAALSLLGFTSTGVAAGSVAASWMSATGTVASGGLFATLQGMGAGGVSTASVFGVANEVCSYICD